VCMSDIAGTGNAQAEALALLKEAQSCPPLTSRPHMKAAFNSDAVRVKLATALLAAGDVAFTSQALQLCAPIDDTCAIAQSCLKQMAELGQLEELQQLVLADFPP
jgi:hypothetical protein